jgi:hypothetical protein
MRRSLFLIALLLSTRWAVAGAQDLERHGFWLEFALGAGPARFACDSCDYNRATGNNSSQLGGWVVSFGAGGTSSPRLRAGFEYRAWLHRPFANDDTTPEIELLNFLVVAYARDQGGPFLELGAGVSAYSLAHGVDLIEPASKTGNPLVDGGGVGVQLGVGWEFKSGLTGQVIYSLAREQTLKAGGGATVATGWRRGAAQPSGASSTRRILRGQPSCRSSCK